MADTFSLTGKNALITGASRGLGAAIAKTLAKQGAAVAINYHRSTNLADKVAEDLRTAGYTAHAIQGDVLNETSCANIVDQTIKLLGSLDILVVNATPPQKMAPLEEYSHSDYQSMLDAFALSPYFLTKYTLPGMKTQQWGRIINITSEVIDTGITDYSAYVTAKGAQTAWTRCMARELAPHGITVNNVAPGWIPVERHTELPQEAMDAYTARVPAGHMGTPEDIAHVVAFFASPEAGFVNGQSLSVNGANTVT